MKSTSVLAAFFFVIIGCQDRPIDESYTNILRPRLNVSIKTLMDNGFQVAKGDGVDVPILEKQVGDSLVYYQFENEADDDAIPLSIYFLIVE